MYVHWIKVFTKYLVSTVTGTNGNLSDITHSLQHSPCQEHGMLLQQTSHTLCQKQISSQKEPAGNAGELISWGASPPMMHEMVGEISQLLCPSNRTPLTLLYSVTQTLSRIKAPLPQPKAAHEYMLVWLSNPPFPTCTPSCQCCLESPLK